MMQKSLMKHDICETVFHALDSLCASAPSFFISPVVVAFSGGADSTFLLLAMREYFIRKGKKPADIHAVYIDHGWRAESRDEAQKLKGFADSLGVSYHSYAIDTSIFSRGNLEDVSRRERYRILKEAAELFSSMCLCTGHHADDQAEVVLKRFFEGSSFQAFSGMSYMEKMAEEELSTTKDKPIYLVRPLLDIRRRDIEQWLTCHGVSYLTDPTNVDIKNLRSRFRISLFPFIEESFGKEVKGALLRVSHEAQRHALFVDHVIGTLCSSILPCESYPARVVCFYPKGKKEVELLSHPYLVEQIFHRMKRHCPYLSLFSRSQVLTIAEAFCKEGEGEKILYAGTSTVLVGPKKFFSVDARLHRIDVERAVIDLEANSGSCVWGNLWRIEWRAISASEVKTLSSGCDTDTPLWIEVLQGRTVRYIISIPRKRHTCSIGKVTEKELRKSRKRPGIGHNSSCQNIGFSHLRAMMPSIYVDDILYASPSEGYVRESISADESERMWVQISISFLGLSP